MDGQSRSELKRWTLELLRINREAESFYMDKARKPGYEPDFYGKVKPFADHVNEVREKWLPLAYEFIQFAKPLHLHPIQIQQTEDNLEVVAIKSFYGKSSLKIQKETYKAVEFTLEQMLRALNEAGE